MPCNLNVRVLSFSIHLCSLISCSQVIACVGSCELIGFSSFKDCNAEDNYLSSNKLVTHASLQPKNNHVVENIISTENK